MPVAKVEMGDLLISNYSGNMYIVISDGTVDEHVTCMKYSRSGTQSVCDFINSYDANLSKMFKIITPSSD